MNKSETINELASALAKAQMEIKHASKDRLNPFFRSSYADLSSIWDVCREPLSKNGIAVSQVPFIDETEILLETILMHSSGQWISGVYPIRPVKNDPQGLGSAITYSRRYSLSAMVGIASSDEDDDGNAASKPTQNHKRPQPNPRPTPPKAKAPQSIALNVATQAPAPTPKPPQSTAPNAPEKASVKKAISEPKPITANLSTDKCKILWERAKKHKWTQKDLTKYCRTKFDVKLIRSITDEQYYKLYELIAMQSFSSAMLTMKSVKSLDEKLPGETNKLL